MPSPSQATRERWRSIATSTEAAFVTCNDHPSREWGGGPDDDSCKRPEIRITRSSWKSSLSLELHGLLSSIPQTLGCVESESPQPETAFFRASFMKERYLKTVQLAWDPLKFIINNHIYAVDFNA